MLSEDDAKLAVYVVARRFDERCARLESRLPNKPVGVTQRPKDHLHQLVVYVGRKRLAASYETFKKEHGKKPFSLLTILLTATKQLSSEITELGRLADKG
jgi:hypothetical protein